MVNNFFSVKVVVHTLIVLMLFFVLPDSATAVVYVDQSRPGGNGTSWASAFKTLEAAIAGSGENQEFWVADGTYTPVSPLAPKEGSRFYGGFSGNESSVTARNIAAFQTIIDGQYKLVHSFNIQVSNARLDGFKIQNGLADDGNLESRGGGVLVGNSSGLVLANCTFFNNSSSYSGGAIYLYNVSAVNIENCLFAGNSSGFGGAIESYNSDLIVSFCQFNNNLANLGEKRGGAIRAYLKSIQIKSCIFTGNVAEQGGAVELNDTPGSAIQCSEFKNNRADSSNPDKGAGGAVALMYVGNEALVAIKHCLFQNNTSHIVGGGLYSYMVPVLVQDSKFIGNSSVNGGGLMLDYKTSLQSTVQRCFFSGNTATVRGGAIRSYIRSMAIEDTVFAYNSAPGGGAVGLHAGESPDPGYTVSMKYCTLFGNKAIGEPGTGGGVLSNLVKLYVYNSIFWGNDAQSAGSDLWYVGASTMETWNSDIQSLGAGHGSVTETNHGGFSLNPLFVDPDGADNTPGTGDDNFQLRGESPCVNKADAAYKTSCDALPALRIDGADVGAYEWFAASPSPCPSTLSCAAFPAVSPPPLTPPTISPSSSPAMPSVFLLLLRG